MELTVRGHDLHISDELREFAERRTDGLDKLLDNVVDAKLELRRAHQRSASSGAIAAQITIQTGRNILRAEERDNDAIRAVDLAIDKIQRQARRVHERRADRKGPRAGELEEALPPIDTSDDEETESVAKLVRRKRFSVKPMDPEEAIEQMELLGHDFYLFHNAEESQINVVYRRQDGTYGLLSPA
jgi:putative sigma-54 modulation protein